jgi:hypothetical protein
MDRDGMADTITLEELEALLAQANTPEEQDDLADLIEAASSADELIRTKPRPVSEIASELSAI